MLRKFRHCHLESRLDGGHNLLVTVGRNKGYRQTLCAKPASTAVKQDIRPKMRQAAGVRKSRTQHDADNYQHREDNRS
jgi:hypothetical protein